MKDKKRRVVEFWVLAARLKEVIRSGAVVWGVKAPRMESVAEHVYGTQMLAIAMASEFDIEVDLNRVMMMLATHELCEAITGDITPGCGVSEEDKFAMEHAAMDKIRGMLGVGEDLMGLFLEFEENRSAEARFCNQIDKLENVLQMKVADEEGWTDYETPREEEWMESRRLEMRAAGNLTLGKAWVVHGIEKGQFEGVFLEMAEWLKEEGIRMGEVEEELGVRK
ncbi:HD domain-containing protein [Candidatus Saccharibacteria bacterium]|nr:HD domain-containing protein [Candidatus Saccharibacteria bacterium]